MTRGEKVIAFIERWCLVPEGKEVGKPIRLEQFQKDFILAVYDNKHITRRALLSMARKNGKTVLIACLLLAHLVGPEARENSQIVSGAQSRDQAALVFDLACKMILLSEELSGIIRIIPSSKRLVGIPMGVEYKALAAEGKTAHGLSPVLAILDEIGQIRGPRDEFVDAVVTSQGAHESPLLIAISTQAANDADLFSLWIDDAMTGLDPHTICHLYTAPDDCDLRDKAAQRAANPALGVFRSEADVEAMAEQAHRMPSFENTYRNLVLNQRIATNSPAISRDVWKQNGKAPIALEDCDDVFGGLDLSSNTALTALVLIGLKGGRVNVHCYAWMPQGTLLERSKEDRAPYDLWHKQGFIMTTPGKTVEYDFVAEFLAEIAGRLPNLRGIAYDRWRISILKKELDRIGAKVPLIEWGQGFKDMSPSLEALDADLLNKKMRHGNNPVLTMCAVNSAIVRDAAGNRKLDKIRSTARIDCYQALAMAEGLSRRPRTDEAANLDDFLANVIVG